MMVGVATSEVEGGGVRAACAAHPSSTCLVHRLTFFAAGALTGFSAFSFLGLAAALGSFAALAFFGAGSYDHVQQEKPNVREGRLRIRGEKVSLQHIQG
jgi:hypothetical protein